MSSDRQFAPRSFYSTTKRKKSIIRPLVIGSVVIGAGVIGYIEFWPSIYGWFQPKVEIIYSQQEAIDKLQKILASWNGDKSQLVSMAKDPHAHFNWIESEEAKDSAVWLIANELDRRGEYTVSEPLIIDVFTKKLPQASSLNEDDQKHLWQSVFQWADIFAQRGHTKQAKSLYLAIAQYLPEGDTALKTKNLIALAQLANEEAAFPTMGAYVKQLSQPKILQTISSTKDVKTIANLLLLNDQLESKKQNKEISEGTKKAKDLLVKHRMTNSPEMGKIILIELKPALAQINQASEQELKNIMAQLEATLICFRATSKDMEYTPETMLALAHVKRNLGQLKEADQLLAQAEGSAMTLGVDAPRILAGTSISEESKAQRQQLDRVAQAETLIKKAYVDANLADSFVKAKNWEEANKYLNQAMEVAKQHTKFPQALLPILLSIEANMFAQQEKYPEAEGRFSYIIDTWDNLSEEDKQLLANNLQTLNTPDFYQLLHRSWADVCYKQNRTTEAKRVLAKIGEEPKEEPKSSSRKTSSRKK